MGVYLLHVNFTQQQILYSTFFWPEFIRQRNVENVSYEKRRDPFG